MKRLMIFILLLLIMSPAVAQEKELPKTLEVVTKSWPEPHAISQNIVFVVDASSTINRYEGVKKKFEMGWNFLTQQFCGDSLYFRVYVFHDAGMERRTKWVDAGGPEGLTKFYRAKKWIMANTGIYSWGLKALRMALREKNPLDRNAATAKSLTIVLFTDGGLTEASTGYANEEAILNSTLKNHVYKRTGSFSVVDKMIEQEQIRRRVNGLSEATIVTIGFENIRADIEFGLSVKQSDTDCQSWLERLGKKYHGGNFLVKTKETK